MQSINEIIKNASDINASDIHICVGRSVQYRVGGNLKSANSIELKPEDVENYAKSLVEPNIFDESQLSMDFAKTIDDYIRIRCNIYKEKGNFACAIRILPLDVPCPKSLFLPKTVIDIADKTRGLVLVTGPTGHGKTTTLAGITNYINENYNKHIITLEDPIEYVHSHKKSIINQREIGIDANTFDTGLRDALRQDPDIILVGEMRDTKTIETALTASETGHLVLATLHTMDCATTISRIVDVFPAEKQAQIRVMLADVIECIISQRLVTLKDGSRRAVYEVLTATSAVKSLIRENQPFQLYSQMQISKKDGMKTLDESLFDMYKTGLAEKEELIKLSLNPVELERKMI
ncbi:MAG: PilT/PilU family type 4a pilus ATPase [Clostridia bacterium]